MTLVTSRHFASTAASGGDWRDVSRRILEALEPLRKRDEPFNLGFLYVSDHLADDLASMLALIRSVTGIEHWVGTVGIAVCASGVDYIDVPAASVMAGYFPPETFRVFPSTDLTLAEARDHLEPWLDEHDTVLNLVHGDPDADADPALVMAELERLTGGFIAGGLGSSRGENFIVAGGVAQNGLGGVVFSSDINVATTISQGCIPVGPVHTMTRTSQNMMVELDGRRALDVFTEDLKAMELVHDQFDRGEIHVAFPLSGSDQQDYIVRDIVGIDPDNGRIAVMQPVEAGHHVQFMQRDRNTVSNDLIRAMVDLRNRVIREQGSFSPQAALYISCAARVANGAAGEMGLVGQVMDGVPLAGFYAGGEISNRQLYGYTGILIVFL